MKDLLKLLDENLAYVKHEIQEDTVYLYAKSKRKQANCPYCRKPSKLIHSRTKRTLQDLPVQGKKAKLILGSKKYFCKNPKCERKTFAERFVFFKPKATKTNRLQEEILRVSLNQSSISASRYLRESVADVGKSTICTLLKKGYA